MLQPSPEPCAIRWRRSGQSSRRAGIARYGVQPCAALPREWCIAASPGGAMSKVFRRAPAFRGSRRIQYERLRVIQGELSESGQIADVRRSSLWLGTLVDPCRLELQTSCVSSRRSGQLSYGSIPTRSTLPSLRFDRRSRAEVPCQSGQIKTEGFAPRSQRLKPDQ
jgi:hypothetical protein